MIINCSNLNEPETLDFDICIIGGGVAGITIAMELNDSGLKVALLEGGGKTFTADSQDLYRGKNIGKPYYDLDVSRLRFFGGTSNHWGANCRELQEHDFEYRSWVHSSGWPISKMDIVPFYEKAAIYCKISEREKFTSKSILSPELRVTTRTDNAKLFMTQFAPETNAKLDFKPLSFGDEYFDDLQESKNVTVFLNANVTELIEYKNKAEIESAIVKSNNLVSFKFFAKSFVLSSGGLENARLLLGSKNKSHAGIGNKNDLVGRFFQEHLSITFGVMIPKVDELSYYDIYESPKRRLNSKARELVRTKSYLTFSSNLLKSRRMLNTSVSLRRLHAPKSHDKESYKSFKSIVRGIKDGGIPEDFHYHLRNVLLDLNNVSDAVYWKLFNSEEPIPIYRLSLQAEQAPNKNSRIKLSQTEVDKFGKAKVELDWQLAEIDYHTIRETAHLTAIEMGATNEGRVIINLPDSNQDLHEMIHGDWHHMGTTRMGKNPKDSVVDMNCKVHEVKNLYLAGSSVFPTGGHSVPTFTIVALAVRLAKYIKEN